MWYKGAFGISVLMLSLLSITAFVPSTPLSLRVTSGRHHAVNGQTFAVTTPPAARRQSSTALTMIDQDILFGAGIALTGLVTGIGLVVFTEQQGERTAQRGTMSSTTKQRMSAMFMEDDELPGTDVADVRTRLREALETDKVPEELQATNAKIRAKAAEDADDGW